MAKARRNAARPRKVGALLLAFESIRHATDIRSITRGVESWQFIQ
jgi:hypothetical protein